MQEVSDEFSRNGSMLRVWSLQQIITNFSLVITSSYGLKNSLMPVHLGRHMSALQPHSSEHFLYILKPVRHKQVVSGHFILKLCPTDHKHWGALGHRYHSRTPKYYDFQKSVIWGWRTRNGHKGHLPTGWSSQSEHHEGT